jgi:hypothetical protein
MWTRIYVWTEKTSRKMTPGKTKILWADTITIDLRDMYRWEVDETGLGPYSVAVAQWLKYCAINRKVVGSIPDGVIGIFH